MEDRKTRPLDASIRHYKQLNERDFIGNWDLPEDGTFVKVTIEDVHSEEVFNARKNKKEWKTVATLKGKKKKLVLNDVNMSSISTHYGGAPKLWVGKEIEIHKTTTKLAGEVVDCIRVKAKSNSAKAVESVK